MLILAKSVKAPLDEDDLHLAEKTMKAYKVLKVILTMNTLVSIAGILMAVLLICGLLNDIPSLVFANIVFIASTIPICFFNVFQTYATCFTAIQVYFIIVIFNYYVETQGIK